MASNEVIISKQWNDIREIERRFQQMKKTADLIEHICDSFPDEVKMRVRNLPASVREAIKQQLTNNKAG